VVGIVDSIHLAKAAAPVEAVRPARATAPRMGRRC